MLEQEFKYFIDNQCDLVKKYDGRVLAIVGSEVVGDYDDYEQAYFLTKKEHEEGTFLLQKCTEGDAAYTFHVHSRAIF
ncbi:MAG: hypothetical protein MJZ85_10220 [Bacteroidales bacterium]|nr:hypothetical protein [Bacteroidales bacterium]